MIPNLTLIVAAYILVRLGNMAAQQSARLKDNDIRKAVTIVACALAALLVVLCTFDTLGMGASIGSAIDAKRPRPF